MNRSVYVEYVYSSKPEDYIKTIQRESKGWDGTAPTFPIWDYITDIKKLTQIEDNVVKRETEFKKNGSTQSRLSLLRAMAFQRNARYARANAYSLRASMAHGTSTQTYTTGKQYLLLKFNKDK